MNEQYKKNLQSLAQASKNYTDEVVNNLRQEMNGVYEVKTTDFTIVNVDNATYQVNFSNDLIAAIEDFKQPLYFSSTLMTVILGSSSPSMYFTPNSHDDTVYTYFCGLSGAEFIKLTIEDVSSDNLSYSYTINIHDEQFSGGSGGTTVSGTNDGTNWTSITIGNDTYAIPSGSSASSGAYYEIKTSNIAFYDENGSQITSNVIDNLRITMSEGQFEALKEKINPMLTQMGLTALTDINSLITLLNGVFTETSASASNLACYLFAFSNGYCDYSTSALLNGVPVNIPLEFFSNISMGFLVLAGANEQGDVFGTNYALLTAVDGNDAPMGISATWTLSQYGTIGGSSSSESYDLQAGDVTIVGAGIGTTDYEVTLSQDLLDVINEGKKSLFVSGTLMSAFTNGDITTPVLFNNINYKKVTAPNYDYIYGYQNITDLITFTEMTIVFGYATATQKWYLGLLNVDYNLEQMDYDISNLDTRVTTLENAGGSGGTTLYQHNIRLNGTNGYVFVNIITATNTPFTIQTFFDYVYTNGIKNQLCGGIYSSQPMVAMESYTANEIGLRTGGYAYYSLYKSQLSSIEDDVIQLS